MELPKQLFDDLAESLELVAVYVHGSRHEQRAREDSDLDLAILTTGRTLTIDEIGELSEAVGRALDLSADLVDIQELRRATPMFRFRVLTTGAPVWVGDPTELARFQAQAFAEHFDTEYFLKPIRKAFRQRISEGKFAS